jgi:hypothetical protein
VAADGLKSVSVVLGFHFAALLTNDSSLTNLIAITNEWVRHLFLCHDGANRCGDKTIVARREINSFL